MFRFLLQKPRVGEHSACPPCKALHGDVPLHVLAQPEQFICNSSAQRIIHLSQVVLMCCGLQRCCPEWRLPCCLTYLPPSPPAAARRMPGSLHGAVFLSHMRSPTAALLKVVSAGLLQHNTCPICRTTLPVDESRQQEQRRQQRERLEQSMGPRGLPEPLAGLLGGGGDPQVCPTLNVHFLLLLKQWRHFRVKQR